MIDVLRGAGEAVVEVPVDRDDVLVGVLDDGVPLGVDVRVGPHGVRYVIEHTEVVLRLHRQLGRVVLVHDLDGHCRLVREVERVGYVQTDGVPTGLLEGPVEGGLIVDGGILQPVEGPHEAQGLARRVTGEAPVEEDGVVVKVELACQVAVQWRSDIHVRDRVDPGEDELALHIHLGVGEEAAVDLQAIVHVVDGVRSPDLEEDPGVGHVLGHLGLSEVHRSLGHHVLR